MGETDKGAISCQGNREVKVSVIKTMKLKCEVL